VSVYYEDDFVTLLHGDCREVTEWLAADVLVTDPPYGIGWSLHGGGKTLDKRSTNVVRYRERVKKSGIQNDATTETRDVALGLWGTKPFIVFGAWSAPFPPNKQVVVWRKGEGTGVIGSVTGYRRDTELIFIGGDWPPTPARWSSVITTDAGHNAYVMVGHSHAKPTGLMETLIERSPGGIIADPFAGSGSTLVAAKHLGRCAIGVELEEKYCEIAAKRLAQDTLFGGAA
jgi:site-specific DNA-methyltransferase (adenine-specific)